MKTGNSAIVSYQLQQQNEFVWVLVSDSALTHFVVTGLNPNTYYNFRVRALNVHGAGQYSQEFSSLTSMRPEKPLVGTTELSNLNIKISWQAPVSNH